MTLSLIRSSTLVFDFSHSTLSLPSASALRIPSQMALSLFLTSFSFEKKAYESLADSSSSDIWFNPSRPQVLSSTHFARSFKNSEIHLMYSISTFMLSVRLSPIELQKTRLLMCGQLVGLPLPFFCFLSSAAPAATRLHHRGCLSDAPAPPLVIIVILLSAPSGHAAATASSMGLGILRGFIYVVDGK